MEGNAASGEVLNLNCLENYMDRDLNIMCTDGVVRTWKSKGNAVAQWPEGSFTSFTQLDLDGSGKIAIPLYRPPMYTEIKGLPERPTDIVVTEVTARNLPESVLKLFTVYTPNTNPGHFKRDGNNISYVDSLIRWNH